VNRLHKENSELKLEVSKLKTDIDDKAKKIRELNIRLEARGRLASVKKDYDN
jgi:hypothetical protein